MAIHLTILVSWIFSGLYALLLVERFVQSSGRFRPLINFGALFFGPAAILLIGGYRQAYKVKSQIARLTGIFSQDDAPPDMEIVIIDNTGKEVFTETRGTGGDLFVVLATKEIIFEALRKHASDILIDPKGAEGYFVRYRIDGVLHNVRQLETPTGSSLISAIKGASAMDISERRRPQDGAFSAKTKQGSSSFRVASIGVFGGEKLSIRILGISLGPTTLADIGLPAAALQAITSAIHRSSGMILLCGPTGSGKTSTLYAMLREIDYTMCNVISIEDPIERVIHEVSQMEVNLKADITFASLLRCVLRQDPNVICIGEIRDEETAQVAVHAAQTGHLIIGTMHSNDGPGTISRLNGLGVDGKSIAGALSLVVSQRLLRQLCNCSRSAELPEKYAEFFTKKGLPVDSLRRAVGCPFCDDTGYQGRMAIVDVLSLTDEMKTALERSDFQLSSFKVERDNHGLTPLTAAGLYLAASGATSIEEVERVCLHQA
ncbi:MAG: GspE/PulE family protein [Candidatus Ozemobacteraceae bacterium]